MARTIEQIIQEQIGALVLQNAKLIAELELAREILAERDRAAQTAKAPTATPPTAPA